MIPTNNVPFAQWDDPCGVTSTLTAAMLDRILHHAHIFQINEDGLLALEPKESWLCRQRRQVSDPEFGRVKARKGLTSTPRATAKGINYT